MPDDVLSGLTYTEANITKEFPDYMMNVVDKSDGHPVRLGDKSIRFEVRSGDCFDWAIGGSSDCTRYPLIDFQGDRERYELATDVFKNKEHWFSWSIYFPADYTNNWPLKNLYGQFHEKDGGNVIWSFEQYPNGIVLTKEKGLGGTEMKQFTVLGNNELPGKWHDFLIHAKFSKNDDGFF